MTKNDLYLIVSISLSPAIQWVKIIKKISIIFHKKIGSDDKSRYN
ncbi:conserved hypothetical protein [Xenorhabdus bovienii str. Jollieti]|nr:conserved hypothetical protein [Xenorhabdus bovienii str. Jollieti]